MTDSAAPNPDPAVFEAAFVIDDSDEPSRSGTPAPPPPPEKDNIDGGRMSAPKGEEGDKSLANGANADKEHADDKSKEDGDAPAPAELSPEIKQRLRKLEKLESTYPGMRDSPVVIN